MSNKTKTKSKSNIVVNSGSSITVSLNSKAKPLEDKMIKNAKPEQPKVAAAAPTKESTGAKASTAEDDDEDLSDLEDVEDDPTVVKSEGETPVEETETGKVDLEVDLEGEEDLDIQAVDNGVLEIFSEKCLRCSHLVPHAEKKFNSCHFSKGNTRCPASSVQILIGIPLDKIVAAFMTAEYLGDNARLGRLYKQLAEKPAWQQQRIQEALTNKRLEQKPQKPK